MIKAGIITVSDKGSRGEREDLSGAEIVRILVESGVFEVAEQSIVPDEPELIEQQLILYADQKNLPLILTTGGTGLSVRDVTPEATLAVATRSVPGIAEAMRAESMRITKRAMLSRGVSVLRNKCLIVNLPGSPKAVAECLTYILSELEHGIRILLGQDGECAR